VHLPDPIISREDVEDVVDPEQRALLAEGVGLALLVVLDTLAPAERLAFVLHDMFAVPFDEIAPIVGRSPTAAKMLASRARRRVQGAAPVPDADLARQRAVVDAFFAAARDGDFDALFAVLDPDVVVRADGGAVPAGTSWELRGAAAVARAGAHRWGLLAACPARPTGVGERRRGRRHGCGGTTVCGRGLHRHGREDCRDRRVRRPRAASPARPGDPQQLTTNRRCGSGHLPLSPAVGRWWAVCGINAEALEETGRRPWLPSGVLPAWPPSPPVAQNRRATGVGAGGGARRPSWPVSDRAPASPGGPQDVTPAGGTISLIGNGERSGRILYGPAHRHLPRRSPRTVAAVVSAPAGLLNLVPLVGWIVAAGSPSGCGRSIGGSPPAPAQAQTRPGPGVVPRGHWRWWQSRAATARVSGGDARQGGPSQTPQVLH
jgi:hypothetical protein